MEKALGQGTWAYSGNHAEMILAGAVEGAGPTEDQTPR